MEREPERPRYRKFPSRFWSGFMQCWRQQWHDSGARPTSAWIKRWYELNADRVWGDKKPTLAQLQRHANCSKPVILGPQAANGALRLHKANTAAVPARPPSQGLTNESSGFSLTGTSDSERGSPGSGSTSRNRSSSFSGPVVAGLTQFLSGPLPERGLGSSSTLLPNTGGAAATNGSLVPSLRASTRLHTFDLAHHQLSTPGRLHPTLGEVTGAQNGHHVALVPAACNSPAGLLTEQRSCQSSVMDTEMMSHGAVPANGLYRHSIITTGSGQLAFSHPQQAMQQPLHQQEVPVEAAGGSRRVVCKSEPSLCLLELDASVSEPMHADSAAAVPGGSGAHALQLQPSYQQAKQEHHHNNKQQQSMSSIPHSLRHHSDCRMQLDVDESEGPNAPGGMATTAGPKLSAELRRGADAWSWQEQQQQQMHTRRQLPSPFENGLNGQGNVSGAGQPDDRAQKIGATGAAGGSAASSQLLLPDESCWQRLQQLQQQKMLRSQLNSPPLLNQQPRLQTMQSQPGPGFCAGAPTAPAHPPHHHHQGQQRCRSADMLPSLSCPAQARCGHCDAHPCVCNGSRNGLYAPEPLGQDHRNQHTRCNSALDGLVFPMHMDASSGFGFDAQPAAAMQYAKYANAMHPPIAAEGTGTYAASYADTAAAAAAATRAADSPGCVAIGLWPVGAAAGSNRGNGSNAHADSGMNGNAMTMAGGPAGQQLWPEQQARNGCQQVLTQYGSGAIDGNGCGYSGGYSGGSPGRHSRPAASLRALQPSLLGTHAGSGNKQRAGLADGWPGSSSPALPAGAAAAGGQPQQQMQMHTMARAAMADIRIPGTTASPGPFLATMHSHNDCKDAAMQDAAAAAAASAAPGANGWGGPTTYTTAATATEPLLTDMMLEMLSAGTHGDCVDNNSGSLPVLPALPAYGSGAVSGLQQQEGGCWAMPPSVQAAAGDHCTYQLDMMDGLMYEAHENYENCGNGLGSTINHGPAGGGNTAGRPYNNATGSHVTILDHPSMMMQSAHLANNNPPLNGTLATNSSGTVSSSSNGSPALAAPAGPAAAAVTAAVPACAANMMYQPQRNAAGGGMGGGTGGTSFSMGGGGGNAAASPGGFHAAAASACMHKEEEQQILYGIDMVGDWPRWS